jgi:hypothetical protein
VLCMFLAGLVGNSESPSHGQVRSTASATEEGFVVTFKVRLGIFLMTGVSYIFHSRYFLIFIENSIVPVSYQL